MIAVEGGRANLVAGGEGLIACAKALGADAEVSAVHANFIVNRGEATSADIIGLVRKIRARVKAAKGVDLEPEVMLYGRDWRDVL